MMEKTFRFWGPAFLLCNFAFLPELDFLALGLVGFYLCNVRKIRGCAYSLILLCGFALLHNSPFELAIVASLALTFLITALIAERETLAHQSLIAQMDARSASLQHLEEELAKTHETTVKTQLAFTEKNTLLQKELEELQSDHSSILILNEVLRQTTARHAKVEEEQRIRIQNLTTEIEVLKKDLDRPLATQNGDLMKELNAARVGQEQTHLINETLARLYARESLKAKEADQEIGSLKEQLRAQRPQNNPFLADQLAFAKEKLAALLQIEPKYRQLRDQFEERNVVLHETRAQLFHTDTELQTLRIENEEISLNPIPAEVVFELERLDEENQQLQELVTILSADQKKK